jgi:hypothetical protein
VVGDDTTTTVQNIVAYNSTGGKNITELTGTQGDVLYHNGTNWAKLGAGTAGQLLQTGGAGANPSWVSASGDPWTIRRLTTDFTTTNSTLTLVSDGTNLLRHRPAANTVTEYQAFLLIQTATATNNPRTGWEWATSLVADPRGRLADGRDDLARADLGALRGGGHGSRRIQSGVDGSGDRWHNDDGQGRLVPQVAHPLTGDLIYVGS